MRRAPGEFADGAKAWVFLDGLTFVVDHDASRRSRTGQDAAALAAPMPATVTQVHVTPGQQVRAGDVLVTLEAMKMELPIRAAADGVIKAVNCRVGEMVQPNIPLLEVDERQPEHGPGAGNIEG